MTDHHTNQRGQIRIGAELIKLGWDCIGYQPVESDALIDHFYPGHWSGAAVHPDYPGVVVAVRFYKDLNPGLPPRISTPRGRAWHIEINGRKVASGTGFKLAAQYHSGGKGAETVASRIHSAAVTTWEKHKTPAVTENTVDRSVKFEMQYGLDTVTVQLKPDRDWTWIYFSVTEGRVNEELEASLSQELRTKWSHKRNAYFIRESASESILSKLKELCGVE